MREINIDIVDLASRWSRLGAVIIDGIIALLFALPYMLYFDVFTLTEQGQPLPTNILIIGAIVGFSGFLIVNGYLLKTYGQTVGKRLLDIQITTPDGLVPEFWPMIGKRYFVFWALTYIPLVGNWAGIVDAVFIFRKDKRCLHDMLADTIVQNYNANKASNPTP